MSVRPGDILTPPAGMATAWSPASLPRDHAQALQGFTSARRGKLNLAPLLKRIARNYGLTITATAIWLSSDGQLDRLLVATATHLYSIDLFNAWTYDERIDGQHSSLNLGATLTDLGTHGGTTGIVHSLQVKTELLLSVDGVMYRYYRNEPAGTENFLRCGIDTPPAPVLTSQSPGGNLTALATYSYLKTFVDELGNESSPSASVSLTLVSGNQQIGLSIGGGITGGTTGVSQWKIYRKNPGSAVFNLVTTLAVATTTYADTNSDTTVNANPSAPTAGENNIPDDANIIAEWQDRVVLNDLVYPNNIQVSNANSPTQFSSFTLPTAPADGVRVRVAGPGAGQVSGLANLGSYLFVFTRKSAFLLVGDDSTQFVLRQLTQAKGCQNPYTVQQLTDGRVLFVSDDGVYSIDGGYNTVKISDEIDDIFHGFQAVAQMGEPTATGRPASIQVVNAIFENARSFVSDNRYYLAIGNRTLCYDTLAGGWSDTGWGYVKTVSRYLSQHSIFTGSAPETLILTLGDVNTFGTALYYFTVADTPNDIDSPSSVASRIVYRPVDVSGQPQANLKRIALVSIYGSTQAPRGSQIGTIRFWADGHVVGQAPILAGIVWRRKGALSEIAGPAMKGELCWIELSFTVNDIEVQNVVTELDMLN